VPNDTADLTVFFAQLGSMCLEAIRKTLMKLSPGGPPYMQEIGTPLIGLHITNSKIKRPRITENLKIGSRKTVISQLHICKIADKKVAYNEGRLYMKKVF